MAKIDALQKFDKDDTHIRHLQTVYLNEHHFELKDIAEWTGYSITTIRSYLYKFKDLIAEAKKTFYHITNKMKKALIAGRQYVYLFKFYDRDIGTISKVGMTTQLPTVRLKQEIKYYEEKGFHIKDTKICSVIDCGDIPADGAESATRAYFIRRYPKAFKKNDRFFGVNISAKLFNEIVYNYLNEEVA